MKKTRKLFIALLCTSLLAVGSPVLAKGKDGPTIAPEANWDAEPAPENYDPELKEKLDKEALGKADTEAEAEVANPIIVLDPGHGGSDPGAVGNGLRECDLTLDIANRAKNYMNANYPASVYMTRTSDSYVSLSDRTTYANNLGANFFVSMHINSYTSSTANGLETYYYTGSTNGQNLATSIYNKLKASYSTLRGVKEATFYVLKYTNMPASLGETGFISNPTDAANLGSSTFRQNLATQYANGMHVYWWGF